MMWTRRRFVKVSATVVAGHLGLGVYTWAFEPHWVRFVHRSMPITNLPQRLDGATLVQISDMHIGRHVDSDHIIDTLDQVRALEPDIVVFTGDFVTYSKPRDYDELARVLEHFPLGTIGNAAILGNHDYGWLWKHADIAAEVVALARDAGLTLLRNEKVEIGGLQIAGLDDYWGPNFEPEPALRSLDPRRAALVLSHNPDTADRPIWNGYRGWILSGHTHGGQCKPPFLPPPLLPVRNRRYSAGAFDLSDGRFMYINRGVGHSVRVRFNVRPEVTVFTLTPA